MHGACKWFQFLGTWKWFQCMGTWRWFQCMETCKWFCYGCFQHRVFLLSPLVLCRIEDTYLYLGFPQYVKEEAYLLWTNVNPPCNAPFGLFGLVPLVLHPTNYFQFSANKTLKQKIVFVLTLCCRQ